MHSRKTVQLRTQTRPPVSSFLASRGQVTTRHPVPGLTRRELSLDRAGPADPGLAAREPVAVPRDGDPGPGPGLGG